MGRTMARDGQASLPIEDELSSWIETARRGDVEALGRALEPLRRYLLLVANEGLDPELKAKVGASDLVQEAFLGAQRDFAAYRGRSEREWRLWLKGILLNLLANHRRRYRALAKRKIDREIPIASHPRFDWPSASPSPSTRLAAAELEADIVAALTTLEEHHRDVVIWRHRDRMPFEEIGRRLRISADAARKHWGRALLALRKELKVKHGL